MIEQAKEYSLLGFSTIPIGKDKIPLGKWTENQHSIINPNGNFKGCYGIGLVCGAVSGGLEVIDIDCKYDLKGTLFSEYKLLINQLDKGLLKKMVVAKTQSGGYHFIYRCDKIEGNLKLASRHTTEEEKKDNPKDKVRVLIETRGEGGYIACFPTPKYSFIYGSLDKVSTISENERETLFTAAKTFNEVFKEAIIKKEYKSVMVEDSNPFEDYNRRGDVIGLLETEGWELRLQRGNQFLLNRPGGTGKWSADWNNEKRLFYVFTSSTEFEEGRAYNATGVLSTLMFGGDFALTAKWLKENGYGDPAVPYKQKDAKSKIVIDDNDYSFVATSKDCDEYINQVRDGTFKMGLSTGFPELDNYWRFKEATLVIANGHDNVGKSNVFWYFAVLSARFYDWTWIIFSSENKVGGVKKKIIEYAYCKSIKSFNELELRDAYVWFDAHFTLILNIDLYTYSDMLIMGRKLLKLKPYNAFLIDPYNSLWRETNDTHEYDYKAMNEFKLFITQTKCSIYLNCHAITEALRRKYPKESELHGYPMPPDKSDTEGGGKFSNKADDFLVIHRMPQHPNHWMNTEIHVKKIKENETGGKQTFLDSPFKMRMIKGSIGFEDMSGFNPILNYLEGNKPKESTITIDYTGQIKTPNYEPPTDFTESNKYITEPPF